MVDSRRLRPRDRYGKSRLGCVVTLLIIALGLYYGIPLGNVYYRYWSLKQEIRTQARLAPSIDNATILRRIQRKAEELNLPEEAKDVSIRRTRRPREITIKTSYEENIELPFFNFTLALTPEVTSPL